MRYAACLPFRNSYRSASRGRHAPVLVEPEPGVGPKLPHVGPFRITGRIGALRTAPSIHRPTSTRIPGPMFPEIRRRWFDFVRVPKFDQARLRRKGPTTEELETKHAVEVGPTFAKLGSRVGPCSAKAGRRLSESWPYVGPLLPRVERHWPEVVWGPYSAKGPLGARAARSCPCGRWGSATWTPSQPFALFSRGCSGFGAGRAAPRMTAGAGAWFGCVRSASTWPSGRRWAPDVGARRPCGPFP